MHLLQKEHGTFPAEVFGQYSVSLTLRRGSHLSTEEASVQRLCHQHQTKTWRPALNPHELCTVFHWIRVEKLMKETSDSLSTTVMNTVQVSSIKEASCDVLALQSLQRWDTHLPELAPFMWSVWMYMSGRNWLRTPLADSTILLAIWGETRTEYLGSGLSRIFCQLLPRCDNPCYQSAVSESWLVLNHGTTW